MFLTVHTAAGVLLGSVSNNPISAMALGMASHFVLDAIPHTEPQLNPDEPDTKKLNENIKKFFYVSLVDTFFSLLVIGFLFYYAGIELFKILPGYLGAVLPDYLCGFAIITKNAYLKKFKNFHDHFHFDNKKPPALRWGILSQILLFSLSISLLLYLNLYKIQ